MTGTALRLLKHSSLHYALLAWSNYQNEVQLNKPVECVVTVNDRYSAVTGANTTDVSMTTYLELGSNSIVRLHSLLIGSRLNRISLRSHHCLLHISCDADDDAGGLRAIIRSSLLTALSTLPLRDVVSLSDLWSVQVTCGHSGDSL